jgi:glutaredoxin
MNELCDQSQHQRERAAAHTSGTHGRAGTVFLLLGTAGLLVAALARMNFLPLDVLRWWLRSEALLILLSIVALLAGGRLVWHSEHSPVEWQPRTPGRRFHSLVLYTREGCCLCEEAAELLARYRSYLPPATEVDIDTDPRLRERFATCVPVVEIDGEIRFRGVVNEVLLRRLIDGTPVED